jgi:hypothetical protein
MAERATPAFTRHVREEWPAEKLPELIEQAEAVERLLAHPGWYAVQRVLDREIATIDRVLDTGLPKEAAAYAKEHGRRGALRAADEAARAIIEQAARQRHRAEEERAAQAREERTAA